MSSFQSFANFASVMVTPIRHYPFAATAGGGVTAATLDAAGESVAFIGHVQLSTGPGTSATLSASGGKLYFVAGSPITFAQAGTTIRMGLQDVGAAGLEDGTYDAYGELIGGTGTITANVVTKVTVSSGTKTLTHGDLIAVVVEVMARAGVDSILVGRGVQASSQPYCTVDSGSGPALSAIQPCVTLECDNGTIGWFPASSFAAAQINVTNYASNSTPDEHALIFRLPVAAQVDAVMACLTGHANTDDFEVILYADPLGTPTVLEAVTQDMDKAATGSYWERPLSTAYPLAANTDYAVALRPTTTNTLGYIQMQFGAGNSQLRKATMLGTDWYLATRTNQTGAFGSPDLTILPMFGVRIQAFHDGAKSPRTRTIR